MKICIDAGHGGSSSGAAGSYSLEKDITLQLTVKLKDKLSKSGIDTVLTRSDDSYLDLQERCDIANKAKCDYFISIHCNAFSNPSASGTETFYCSGNKEGLGLATAIQDAAIKYNKNINRGVKTADFYVILYTDMPAVLHEAAFISNSKEENMMNDIKWQDGFTDSLAEGICRYLGMTPQSSGTAPQSPGTTQPQDSGKYPISGVALATAEQMESYVRRINPNAPYLAQKYIDIGSEEGIKGDMAYAQAILETGFFRFKGIVKPEQNNFCGLGATGPGAPGAYFKSVDDGIKAHIQHLKAYANKEPLKSSAVVDPRFGFVERGIAPNWEDLNGRWAVPGNVYGQTIIDIWCRILLEKASPSENTDTVVTVSESNVVTVSERDVVKAEEAVNFLEMLIQKLKSIIRFRRD